MANTIKLAHNANSGKTPTNLAAGEIAINSANKKIWVGTDDTTAGQVLLFDHSIYSTDLSDNDTTYTAGGGLSLSGTVFSHSDTSSQGSIDGTGRQYIQDVTLDTYGHVTGLGVATETVTNTNTTYSAGTGLSLSGTTFSLNGAGIAGGNISWDGTQLNASIGVSNVGAGNGLTGGGGSATSTLHVGAGGGITVSADAVAHADTSSQGSINLSGRQYIQDLTLDTYGHVTGYGYGTETVTDSDTNTTYSAGTALTLSGTTFSLTNSTQYLKKLSAGSAANLDTYTDNGFRSVSHTGHSKLLLSMNAGGSTGTFQLENHYNGQCRVRNKVDSTTWADWEYLVSTTTGQTAISGTILHTGNLTAGGGLTRSSTTISHSDTSSQGSINLSGRSYIQDLTLDTYGHVTGYGYGTETVTNTNTTYTAGTGLSLSGTTFNMTAAGVGVRGGVKLGYPESGQFYPVEAHGTSERLYVNVPWQNTTYVVQDGGLTQKNFTTTLKNKLDGLITNALPQTGGTLNSGGNDTTLIVQCKDAGRAMVQIGDSTDGSQGTGVLELTQDGNYGGGISYNGDNSPSWASGETSDTITFYRMSAGTRTEVFSYPYSGNTVTFNGQVNWSGGNSANANTAYGWGNHAGAGYATQSWVNSQGFLTSETGDIQGVTAGSGLSGGGTSGTPTLSHADTSSQASINLSGRQYIQDLTLDTYGHVTGYGYATETVTNTDTNTTYSAGTGLSLSGTTFSLATPTVLASAGNYVWSASTTAGNYTTGLQTSFVRSADGWPNYGSVLHVGARGGTDAGGDFQIYCGHGSAHGGNYLRVRNADNSASPTDSWTSWRTIWDSGNVSAGTGISISGTTITNTVTNTNTTYSAGSGLSLSGTTFSHSDTSSQGSINLSGRQYIQDLTLDTYGHVTGYGYATETVTNTDTNTTYSAGSGLSLSGTTFSHSDTSSQASINLSGRQYIQDLTLDTYGHVTGYAYATETVTNTDTNTTYSAGTMLSLSGTTFSLATSSRPVWSANNQNNWDTIATASSSQGGLEIYNNGAGNDAFMAFHCGGDYACYFGLDADNNKLSVGGWSMGANKYQIYHSGNPSPNTTYSAGSGLSLSGTTFSHSDTSSQASINLSGRQYIQDLTLDTYGHVTGYGYATETVTNTDTNTTYSAGSGLSLSGTTFSHADTSSQSSVDGSGRQYIQDITLDTYGHVTGIGVASETVTNTNTVREIYLNASAFLNNSSGGAAFDLRTSSPLHFSYSSGGVAILAHYDTAGNKHIPSGGSSNQYLIYASNGTANWSTIAFSHLQNLSALNALP